MSRDREQRERKGKGRQKAGETDLGVWNKCVGTHAPATGALILILGHGKTARQLVEIRKSLKVVGLKDYLVPLRGDGRCVDPTICAPSSRYG